MRAHTPSLAALLLATAAHPAWAQTPATTPPSVPATAQQAPAPQAEAEDDGEVANEVTVIGQRERGSVPGDIPPEQVLGPADIRAYGANSLTDLLAELAPQLGSGRGSEGGMPVVLLNGRRISGFREIASYPPEAIERIDILPPEAAQQLGFRPEQRVVNFVLRRRFNAVTAEIQGGGATQGDRFSTDNEVGLVRIMRDKRLNATIGYEADTPVFEADRTIIPTPPSRPYAITGNLTPATGLTQIDPALSALAGAPLTVAGVPVDVRGRPALSSFLGGTNPSDFSAYRTLRGASQKFESSLSYAQPISSTVTASLSAGFDWTKTDSALGLATASLTVPAGNPFSPFTSPVVLNRYLVEGGARTQARETTATQLNGVLNGDIGRWRWSLNGSNVRTFSSTFTDIGFDVSGIAARLAANDPTVNPFAPFTPAMLGAFGQDYARSLRNLATVEAQANGPVATLPAGDSRLTVRSSFIRDDLSSRAIRSGVATAGEVGRSVGTGLARIDLPIANRGRGVLSAIGNLSLNANYEFNQVSDFGWLSTYGYGVTWSPVPGRVSLLASVNRDANAPTTNQLGDPVVVSPNARVFDFVRGTSVDVTLLTGGNPNLLAPERRTTTLTLNARPFASEDFNIRAEYNRTRALNPIQFLSTPTAALEAAFPDRFVRDAADQLIRVDNRPVNIAQSDRQELNWGFNFSRRIGPAAPARGGFGGGRPGGGAPGAAAPTARAETPQGRVGARGPEQRSGPPPASSAPTIVIQEGGSPPPPGGGEGRRFGAGGPGGGRGFGGGGFGGGNEGRVQLSVFHTWRFRDTITIAPGLPVLDQLNGDATDIRGPFEHQIRANGGITKNGYGLRTDIRWQSGTFINGGTARNPIDITAAPQTTVALRGFVTFNPTMKAVRDHPWLLGTRVELAVDNLFDTRLRVRDANGSVPINYQPDLLDPIGRTVTFKLRKLFASRPQGRGGGALGGGAGALRR